MGNIDRRYRVSSLLRVILAAALLGTVCFIFSNSMQTASVSSDASGLVLGLLQRVLRRMGYPGLAARLTDHMVRKAAHFCEYAILGFLLANALRLHIPLARACLVAIACASLFGVTDELHQYFVPGRMCDPLDWLVDTLGASLGALVARAVFSRSER